MEKLGVSGVGTVKVPMACSNFISTTRNDPESLNVLLLQNKRTPAATQTQIIQNHTQREKGSSVKVTGIYARERKKLFAMERED